MKGSRKCQKLDYEHVRREYNGITLHARLHIRKIASASRRCVVVSAPSRWRVRLVRPPWWGVVPSSATKAVIDIHRRSSPLDAEAIGHHGVEGGLSSE